ncbi:DNA polymerase III subunit delta [Alicyclobacillus cycloheptanicus]|nr:DNA polymerase III subunit delta [Alicyclobacillus cycloheptanicus]WDM00742.1 DNA polymerase III subunit delta [Alicyclobacillus cycloheptanicus]
MKDLQTKPLSPVYVLLGTEPWLMRRFIEAVRDRLAEATGQPVDLNRSSFEDDGAEAALAGCETVSLFASSSVQVLENCTALLPPGKAKSGKHDTTLLEAYLANPIQGGNILILTALGEKLDERKKLVKLAKKHVVVDCSTPAAHAAAALVQQMARRLAIDVTSDAIAELVRRTQRLSVAMTELEKLHVYAWGRTIQVEDVQTLVAAPSEDDIFHWIDLAVKGQVKAALDAVDDLWIAGIDPFAVIALLGRQWRLIWYAGRAAQTHEHPRDTAALAGAPPFAMKIAAEQARGLSLGQIEDMLLLVADAELALKQGRRDPHQTVEWLVLEFAAARENRHTRASYT